MPCTFEAMGILLMCNLFILSLINFQKLAINMSPYWEHDDIINKGYYKRLQVDQNNKNFYY